MQYVECIVGFALIPQSRCTLSLHSISKCRKTFSRLNEARPSISGHKYVRKVIKHVWQSLMTWLSYVPCVLMAICAFGLGRIRLVSHSSLNLFKKITNPRQQQQHAITCHFACPPWSQEYLVEYPEMIQYESAGENVCFEFPLGKEMFNHWQWLTESLFIKVKINNWHWSLKQARMNVR